jgi:hypothetical protein
MNSGRLFGATHSSILLAGIFTLAACANVTAQTVVNLLGPGNDALWDGNTYLGGRFRGN